MSLKALRERKRVAGDWTEGDCVRRALTYGSLNWRVSHDREEGPPYAGQVGRMKA